MVMGDWKPFYFQPDHLTGRTENHGAYFPIVFQFLRGSGRVYTYLPERESDPRPVPVRSQLKKTPENDDIYIMFGSDTYKVGVYFHIGGDVALDWAWLGGGDGEGRHHASKNKYRFYGTQAISDLPWDLL